MPERIQMIGYHGTYIEYLENIQKVNFKESEGNNHWLGKGVYFFIEGINSEKVEDLARWWAIDQDHKKKHKEYVVLEAQIDVKTKHIFDMRTDAMQKKFNEVRSLLSQTFLNDNILFKLNDNEIWKFISTHFGVFVVIANVYIEFDLFRQNNIWSRMPNCTIIAVKDPMNHIIKSSIKVIKKGDII